MRHRSDYDAIVIILTHHVFIDPSFLRRRRTVIIQAPGAVAISTSTELKVQGFNSYQM